jgi:ribonuclease PH
MPIFVDNNISYKKLDESINNRINEGCELLHVVSTGSTTFTCVYSGPVEASAAFREVPMAVARRVDYMEEVGRGKTRNKREKKRTTRRKR